MNHTKYSVAGIQRALSALLQKGFLHKHSKYYQLQSDYLLSEKAEIQLVLDRYIHAETYHQFQKSETFYYFETLSELDYFWNATIEKWFNFYPSKKYSYWQKQPFPWFTILHLDEERRIIKKICKRTKNFKTFCVENTLTKKLRPIYSEHRNSSLHLMKNLPNIGHAFAIFGDHVIETHHPPSIVNVLQKLCSSQANSILFKSILQLAKRGSYKLAISKDKTKAEKYRRILEGWMIG